MPVLTSHEAALAFLQKEPLRNIVLLKMIQAYSANLQCLYAETGASAGVLLLLPASVMPFDAQTYPFADYVVIPSVDGSAALKSLIAYVPSAYHLIFKLMRASDRRIISQAFDIRYITAYLSYTSPRLKRFAPDPSVVIADQPDPGCLDLYAEQGHPHAVVRQYFERGQALSFSIYAGEMPISSCFAYQNYGQIWEIGGLYTAPAARRQGLGQKIVATALYELGRAGRIPRYQVHEANRSSIGLASKLGLKRFLTTEHWEYRAKPAIH